MKVRAINIHKISMSRGHVVGALLALAPLVSFAQADSDQLWCRSGTLQVLAQEDKKIIMMTENHGVAQGNANDWFHGSTHRCIGTLANFDGTPSGNGWCKQVSAQTGDWAVLEWTASDQPGKGTWKYRHGTGKWKGISGGGTYEVTGATRPVQPGMYQNCIRVRGKVTIPG